MQGGQHKILVVDDVAANRELLSRYFGSRGFQVAEADCGLTALNMIKQERFSGVFLDILMPVMDGIEVLKRFRAFWTKDTLPIIMVSALSTQRDVKLALELGANDYITKPVDLPAALAKLQRAIDSQKQATGAGGLQAASSLGAIFQNPKEMRRKQRRQVQGIAWILANEQASRTPCVVVDLTSLGACIVLQKDQKLPGHFILLLSQNGTARKSCRVVWRAGLKAGIEFDEELGDKPKLATGALVDRLL